MPKRRRFTIPIALVATLALLASLAGIGTAVAATPNRSALGAGRFLVVAKSHADYDAMRADAVRAGLQIVDDLSATDSLVVTGSASATSALAADAHVQGVTRDHVERIVPPEETGSNPRLAPHGSSGRDHGHRVTPDPAFSLPRPHVEREPDQRPGRLANDHGTIVSAGRRRRHRPRLHALRTGLPGRPCRGLHAARRHADDLRPGLRAGLN